jgi:hypothetical protein
MTKNVGKARAIDYPGLAVPLFFLSFFVLFASGRMSSADAGDQLMVAVLATNTGTLSSPVPREGWILGQDQRYYEPHDLGNPAFMLPAALVGSRLFGGTLDNNPISMHVGVAFCYAIFSAIGAIYLYRLFSLTFLRRTAFFLTLGIVGTTVYWPYSKTAWDVMGACVCMCILLYCCAMVSASSHPRSYAILASVAFGVTCTFRYSLGVFLSVGLVAYLIMQRRKLRFGDYGWCALVGLLVLLPTFAYNWIRMGNPLRPGNTAASYLNGNLALTGDILHGSLGLLLAPNRGLFVYSPILLLVLLLPLYWKTLSLHTRQLTLAFLPSAILYTLLIAKLQNWGTFGWGPRYLVPIIPILAVAAAPIAVKLWHSGYRPWLIALVIGSAVLTIPPVLVNWHLVTVETPDAWVQDAPYPAQQAAVWNGLWLGIHGKPLPTSEKSKGIAEDAIRSGSTRFPDLWLVRLGERSTICAVVATLVALVLLVANVVSFLSILLAKNDDVSFIAEGPSEPRVQVTK